MEPIYRLTDTLNRPPIMTKNLSMGEMLTVAGGIFGSGALLLSALSLICGLGWLSFAIGPLLGLFLTMGLFFPIADKIGKFKLDKPDGYLLDSVWLWLEKVSNGFFPCVWLKPQGVLTILRRNLFENEL